MKTRRIFPDSASDAELPRHVLDLLKAGRAMVEDLERYIEGCGNSMPDEPCDEGCECCGGSRKAVRRWAGAVVRARKAEAKRIDERKGQK